MNITELARRLKITPNELKQALPELGFDIGQRAIQIPDKQAGKVIECWKTKVEKEKSLNKIKDKITKIDEDKETEKDSKSITLPPVIRVYDLAKKINLSIVKVMNELIKNGVLVNVNENLDYEVAAIVAESLGFKPNLGEAETEERSILLKEKMKEVLIQEGNKECFYRPPVVVIIGHVDHGKSSILDAIRESQIVESEKGGITQHIGAYSVKKKNCNITFVDTPGHEAFQIMRALGGEVADMAILVIAADDKIQPQTLESIKVIQGEKIPFIVAINKIDKPEANVEKIKKELAEINLIPEDWGGNVICIPVSTKTKQGIDNLLETITLMMEMEKQRLLTNLKGQLVGVVIESKLDLGVGPVATVIVYNGVLNKGDNVIIGNSYGRLRSIKNEKGESIDKTEAGLPVQIFGLKGLMQVGDLVEVVDSKKDFKKKIKQIDSFKEKPLVDQDFNKNNTEKSVQSSKKNNRERISIILRTDVLGSLEAVSKSLEKMDNVEVEVKIIKSGLGNLTESDVDLAKSTGAWLVSFNTAINPAAKQLATEFNLKINVYYIIYDIIQDLKQEINNLLLPEIIETKQGRAEVLKIFQKSGKIIILGARVTDGKIINNAIVRVWQKAEKTDGSQKEAELKGEGKIIQLQVNKKDVNEAKSGMEYGIKVSGAPEIQEGDILEIFQEIRKERKI